MTVTGPSTSRRLAGRTRRDSQPRPAPAQRAEPRRADPQRAQRPRAQPRAEPQEAPSRLPVSLIALSAAIGLLIVALAYTAGRLGHDGAWVNRAYWAGQGFIIVPAAIRLLSLRALSEAGTITVVVAVTVSEYLTKICFSPTSFTYVDELEHWRSAEDILRTGKLFTPNLVLPISPNYPGLEEVTTALVQVTKLPLYTCGIIVAGVAHLVFMFSLYLIFRLTARAHRIAGIAMLIYSANQGLPFFDSFFVYQTMALAFLGVAVVAAWHLASDSRTRGPTTSNRRAWVVTAALAMFGCVVSHNVTSYLLVATLEVITIGGLLAKNRLSAATASILAVGVALMFTLWVVFFAPQTISYLQPSLEGALGGVKGLLHHKFGSPSSAASLATLPKTPVGNTALAGVAVVLVSAVLPVGVWQIWKHYRRRAWFMAMAAGSMSWYVIVGVRLAVQDGSELAGRSSTFVFVPVGFVAAVALAHFVGAGARRRRRSVRRSLGWRLPAVVGVALVLLANGLANSWPPFWERLPGGFQMAGNERSVTPEQITVSDWTLAKLGAANRFAADAGEYQVLGSYGDQNPLLNVAPLYTTRAFTKSDAELVDFLAVHYLMVDTRMSTMLPASGAYFQGTDPMAGHYTHPIPSADLAKFNHTPGVSRIYDDGNLIIYDVQGVTELGTWPYAK